MSEPRSGFMVDSKIKVLGEMENRAPQRRIRGNPTLLIFERPSRLADPQGRFLVIDGASTHWPE